VVVDAAETDGAAAFGRKRRMERTRNGIAIRLGATQNVRVGRRFKPGIRWALST
jgi:hypothetical protein